MTSLYDCNYIVKFCVSFLSCFVFVNPVNLLIHFAHLKCQQETVNIISSLNVTMEYVICLHAKYSESMDTGIIFIFSEVIIILNRYNTLNIY